MGSAARTAYRLGFETLVSDFDAAYVESGRRGLTDNSRWPVGPSYVPVTRGELLEAHDGAPITRFAGTRSEYTIDRDYANQMGSLYLKSIGVLNPQGALSVAADAVENSPVVQGAASIVGAGDPAAGADMTTWVKVGVVAVVALGVLWGLSSVAAIVRAVRP